MATETTAPVAISWIKAHETIVLFIATLAVVGWLGSKFLDHRAEIADGKSIAAQQQLTLDKQQLDAVQAQFAKDRQDLMAQIQQIMAANAALSQSIANSQAALVKAQAAVPQMTPTQLSQQWQQEIHLPDVKPLANGDVEVGRAEANATVQKLESADALAVQKVALQQEVANDQKHIEDLNTLNADQAKTLLATQKENGSQVAACDAKVNAVKADAAKSKKNWALRMLGVGVAIGLYAASHI